MLKYVVTSCAEEILSSTTAAWWSPDSRYICYATFNDTKVPLFRFPYYGPRSDLYGEIIEFAYPKVGIRKIHVTMPNAVIGCSCSMAIMELADAYI